MAHALVTLVNQARVGDGIAKAVLRSLADRINDRSGDGTAWPSVPTLVDELEFSRRAIQYAMQFLQAEGWIAKAGEGSGGRSLSTRYRLNVERLRGNIGNPVVEPTIPTEKGARLAPFHAPESAKKGAPRAQKGAPRAQKGAPRAPEPLRTVKNRKGVRARKRATPAPERIEVTVSLLTLGQSLGMDRQAVEHELDACLDWHRANGRARVDWLATARNWLRKAKQLNGSRRAAPSADGLRFPRPDDSGAWEALAARHGLESKPGEDWPAYQARIRRAIEAGRVQR